MVVKKRRRKFYPYNSKQAIAYRNTAEGQDREYRPGGRESSLYRSQVPQKARDSQDQYEANQAEAGFLRKQKQPTDTYGKQAMERRLKQLSSRTPITDSENRMKQANAEVRRASAATAVDNKRMIAESERKYGRIKSNTSNASREDRQRRISKAITDSTRPGSDKPNSNVSRAKGDFKYWAYGGPSDDRAQAKRALAVRRLKGKRPIKPGER